ncbi:MAG: 3-oxoacyl-(acyl-carrier-protein) reductase FabG [Firmicutes bacterium ADurb.Bin182]|nr:MAG: 3-oxoacyl-(acyl-carrier-protein) reductase FabG [Firmicutes bacterium ADurb.Bin182]
MKVLITGAAGGLGRALAVECALRGYDLFLTDVNEGGLLSIKRGLLRRFPVKVMIKSCDLTSERETGELFQFADRNGWTFDMLMNVAGIDFEGGFLERSSYNILKIVRLNIEATLSVTHKALARRNGSSKRFYLVFVSSLASMYPMPLKAVYAASKRFLLSLAYALGQELKSRNVSVLALCPGGLPTTPDALAGIQAQGFWGKLTTNRLETVARRTIEKALRGRRVYIPGVVNALLSFFGRLIPETAVAKFLYGRWSKAQKLRFREQAGGAC